jgi:hypothetical protein
MVENITLSGSYIFTEDTLSHTSQNVVLEFVEEDRSSENGLALYIQFPIKKRIGRLFKNDGYWYFDTYPDKKPYKLIQEGLSGYKIEGIQ